MSKYHILKEYEQVLMIIEDILGSGVTNNKQLDKLGNYLFGNDYLGTFSSNQFPRYIKENQCFVLNTDSSRQSGSHWVAFYKLNKKIYYYDSFMRQPSKLSKFWVNKKLINANRTDRDQSFKENDCGSRSLAWIIVFRKFGEKCIDII